MRDRYGEVIESIDPERGEVFLDGGEIIDRHAAQNYAAAEVSVYHGDNLWTSYHRNGQVVQHRDHEVFGEETFTMPDVGAVIERVIELWDRDGGWIPGASRGALARALGVPVDRLRTAQQLKADRVNTRSLEV